MADQYQSEFPEPSVADIDVNPGPPLWIQRAARREVPQQSYHEHDAHYHQYGDSSYPENIYGQRSVHVDKASEQPPKPRGGGMVTVVVVLALACVGTAAAYSYRTFTSPPRNGEVPIIRADAGPSKVAPPAQSADDSGKLVQDRLATQPGSERIVSREEEPIDVNAAKSSPRVVFPPLSQPNPPSEPVPLIASNRPASNSPGSSALGDDEPRKVRTLSIRPDQADTVPTQAMPPAAAKPSTATQKPAPSSANNNMSSPKTPISLSPQATSPVTSSQVTRPVAARAASAMSASPSEVTGGYVVQISSQRSAADAQASYRAIQAKFPNLLRSHSPLIKRADLGEKGVYYRAMVGPFGAPDEALQFCNNLKSAGGQCVVQRN